MKNMGNSRWFITLLGFMGQRYEKKQKKYADNDFFLYICSQIEKSN